MNKNGRFGLLELAASVENLRSFLPGTYLQKFYRLPQKGNGFAKRFLLRFSCRPFRFLMIDVGVRAHLIPDQAYEDTYAEHLPRDGLCSKLKKHLDNGRVTSVNYTPGAKYFEIEFTHFVLAFDFYGKGNLVLLEKPGRTVLISWHVAIKPGTEYKKDLENLPELPFQPCGKGYLCNGVLHTSTLNLGSDQQPVCYDVFGEAAYVLMDKDSKSKLLAGNSKKRRKRKPKRDYKKIQVAKWVKKVDLLHQQTQWLSERSHLTLQECIDTKPKNFNLEFETTYYGTLGTWHAVLKRAKLKLASAQKVQITEKKDKPTQAKVVVVLPKTAWYEQYRWFFTFPNNMLVVAGTSAKSNEELVKRHFDKGDLYFHGDFHGAASVILKCGQASPSPKDLEQAGAFAVCCSSAWKSKITGRPYYVQREQVSKTAEAGEYLSQGSFMVRGKKTFLQTQTLLLGIAIFEKRLCCAPFSALRHLPTCVKIKPGKTKPSKAIQRLKQEMLKKLKKHKEDVGLSALVKVFIQESWQKVMPTGGVTVSRTF